jgi:hypothetical protein
MTTRLLLFRSSVRMASVLLLMLLPRQVAAQQPVTVSQVAWLAGCWQLAAGDRLVEEHWLAPKAGTMLAVGRTIRGNRLVEYETVLLREEGGRLAYEAHPSGQPSTVFLSTEVSAQRVIFENLQHDFPQRVGYERTGDALLAWISGPQNGQDRRIQFQYRSAPCPGSPPSVAEPR